MRFLSVFAVILSCFSCICMSEDKKLQMDKFERMSVVVKKEMVAVSEQFRCRNSGYNDFLDSQHWPKEGGDGIAEERLEDAIKRVVDRYGIVNRLEAFLNTLFTQEEAEKTFTEKEWFVFSKRSTAQNVIKGNFATLRGEVNTMLITIRNELNPLVKLRLLPFVRDRIEDRYTEWTQGDGRDVVALFSEAFKVSLIGKFRAARGKPVTDPTQITLNAYIRDIQTIPTVSRVFSSNRNVLLAGIDTNLKKKYPVGFVEEHEGEVFDRFMLKGKSFMHIPGARTDFFMEFFQLLGILPTSKSMLELQGCTDTVSVNRILRGSGTDKGWVLEALQRSHTDGKTYLNSVLLITDAHAFFGGAGDIPAVVAKEVVNFLKMLIDSNKKQMDIPFFLGSRVDVSELKIVMVGDGDFLDDFFASPPASLIQVECDALVSRCEDIKNYVSPPSGLLSIAAFRRQIDIELNRHERFNQLHEDFDKKKIKERVRSILQGGVVPMELMEDFPERKDYTRSLPKREIIPHIKKLLDHYIDKTLRITG